MTAAAEIHESLSEYYLCPPEEETFGRSASFVRQLGAVALLLEGQARLTAMITSRKARQVREEFLTSVEEGLATDGELGGELEDRDFDYAEVRDGHVMAKDGETPVSVVIEGGLRCARVRALVDEHFGRQLIRTEWDSDIAETGDAMARGETPFNTYMVVSPYPEEGEEESGAEYWQEIGYVPPLKRGFVWLFHAGENGFLTGSLSFSGSNKQRLREVFGEIGVDIPEDEATDNYPGHAFTGNLTEEQAKALATAVANRAGDPAYRKPRQGVDRKITNTVDLTREHEVVMNRVFNESYVHICESLAKGRQTEETRELIRQFADKACSFNKHYESALYRMRADSEQFGTEDWAVMHELLVYSTIEMIRALHLKAMLPEDRLAPTSAGDGSHALPTHLQEVDASTFQNMLGGFGAEGARNNRVYSACGLAIRAGKGANGDGLQSAPGEQESGPEGANDAEGKSSGKVKMNCPFCRAKVNADPCAAVISCWDCGAYTVNGKLMSKGDGGHKARLERRRVEAAQIAERRRQAKEAQAAQSKTIGKVSVREARARQNRAKMALAA